MKILVTGLASLQWGRLEYGNNGNYYLIAPIFHQLNQVFPDAEIVTTFQLSEDFQSTVNVKVLPLSLYYSWRENEGDLKEALEEYAIADIYSKTSVFSSTTPFIDLLKNTDLLVSFNGDMWGDNRDSSNANRLLVDLLKTAAAQKMQVPTVLFASSPGPIDNLEMRKVAKDVYENYDIVINREAISKELFASYGYDVSNTIDLACPAFLFGEHYYPEPVDVAALKAKEGIPQSEPITGFIVTTNSLPGGAFSDWERADEDFNSLAELVEFAVNSLGEKVVLFSHSDGFTLEPEFKRIHWRDYKMVCQLYDVLEKRRIAKMENVYKIDGIYQPWEVHCFIGSLDKLISGKLHGSVAGIEQYVPTMPIDFQNGPIAHKMQGMFGPMELLPYVVPRGESDFVKYYKKLSDEKEQVKKIIGANLPTVQEKAKLAFSKLKEYVRQL